ncbi:J domain-containing protein [Aspergillus mulundensis]|uniref:J domain-containing protein n=1 Tax=Aspergillus mulundensis TaxID=1810919 RepID=A0A3D8SVU4_9EURO|nr:hypothetical protein DSM5745_02056 [Aspergillus mulundensis]RDW90281.1 hypothetical protein DSM5745_02056 [Aspergillus mulundensis]
MEQEMSPNYYEILGIPPTASAGIVKRAYRVIALAKHPDKNPSPDATAEFQLVGIAYETLCDADKRQHYDTHIYPKVLMSRSRSQSSTDTAGQDANKKGSQSQSQSKRDTNPQTPEEKLMERMERKLARKILNEAYALNDRLKTAKAHIASLQQQLGRILEQRAANGPSADLGWRQNTVEHQIAKAQEEVMYCESGIRLRLRAAQMSRKW